VPTSVEEAELIVAVKLYGPQTFVVVLETESVYVALTSKSP